MESPKRPLKKTAPGKSNPITKNSSGKTSVPKFRNKFADDDDEEFESDVDDLGSYEHFDGLHDEDDDY